MLIFVGLCGMMNAVAYINAQANKGERMDYIIRQLQMVFVTEGRYQLIINGLGTTILLSLMAAVIGVAIGSLMTYFKLSRLKLLNWIAGIYIDIIRGTPAYVQLIVIYFVIFGSININQVFIGSVAFGINSGAYVAEIIRAGILSIDKGQTEAGRSLGLSQKQTMQFVVFPQAIKNILPALANEFIVLVKETAVVGTIGVMDLTKSMTMIQGRTYSMFPYIVLTIIYYLFIKVLTIGLNRFEKYMRRSDVR